MLSIFYGSLLLAIQGSEFTTHFFLLCITYSPGVSCLNGIVHPNIILSLITDPHVVPNPQDLHSSSEHKLRNFWWNPRAFWPCVDSNTTTMIKARKGSKDIVKIVHVTHQRINGNFMKLREYYLWAKKNKLKWLNSTISSDATVTLTNYVLTIFLGLEHGSCFAVYAGSESSQISSKVFQRWTKLLRIWNNMRVST